MEVRTKFTQAQDPQERKVLEQEYHVLEKQVQALQQMIQGGPPSKPQKRVKKRAASPQPEKEGEPKELPAAEKAQLSLPQGQPAQTGEAQAPTGSEIPKQTPLAEGESADGGTGDLSPTLIECHVCGTTNLVSTSERPVIVECTSCGEKGYLET